MTKDYKHYKSEEFGRLFKERVANLGSLSDVTELVYEKLRFHKRGTFYVLIRELAQGRIYAGEEESKPHCAIRLGQILHTIHIEEQDPLIEIARNTLGIRFDYPPTENYGKIRKVKKQQTRLRTNTLERIANLNHDQLVTINKYIDSITSN